MLRRPATLVQVFELGMDRDVDWIAEGVGLGINLGAGNKLMFDTLALDLPDWTAGEPMPVEDEIVAAIYAFHFWEHLDKEDILLTLRECERVLKPGGLIISVTPHWDSEGAHQDLDHKSFWSESTWRNLFSNPYYEGSMPRDWKLREVQSIIMGVVQRNLAVVSQVIKVG